MYNNKRKRITYWDACTNLYYHIIVRNSDFMYSVNDLITAPPLTIASLPPLKRKPTHVKIISYDNFSLKNEIKYVLYWYVLYIIL